jgi:hypothetical protein
MHGFVIRIALRQHVPLRPGVEDPQHAVEHFARGNRLAARAIIGNIFLGKMFPDRNMSMTLRHEGRSI